MSAIHPLRDDELEVLGVYRESLPPREWRALSSWLTTFYPFQRAWMLERADYAVINKSRQIGLSHSTAGILDVWGIFHGETTTVISVGDREAAEVLDKARRHRDILVQMGSEMAQPGGRDNASEMSFASGGRVIALPSTAGRSFTGNVFLDEFAYHQHPQKVWDAALAVTMLGFRARVASTPNGIGNNFHQLCTDPVQNAGWAKHEIPLQVAIDQGFPVDIEKCWKLAKGDHRLFDQLFNCRFLDGQLQYLPTELVRAAQEPRPGLCSGYAYAGLDVGKSIDVTALSVIQGGTDGRMHVVHSAECKRTDLDDIRRMVAGAWSRFNIRRLCVDATGMGAFPAEELRKTHGRARVEPVNFTLQSKEQMATALYTAFVGDKVRIPESDEQLFNDLCSIQRLVTDAGNVRYDAPHTEAGHADRAWALALALYAASMQVTSRAQPQQMT